MFSLNIQSLKKKFRLMGFAKSSKTWHTRSKCEFVVTFSPVIHKFDDCSELLCGNEKSNFC